MMDPADWRQRNVSASYAETIEGAYHQHRLAVVGSLVGDEVSAGKCRGKK